jgi:hypothetical protein
MVRRALALILPAALFPLGCSSKSGDAPTPAATVQATAAPTTAAASASPTASQAPAPTAATSAAPEPPVYPPRKVPGGMLNGMWVQTFEIVRDKGNLGLSYLDAMNRCVGYGKILCTDVEWARACETDASLAKIETWTASGIGNNRFVTRGGDESAGCRARDVKDGADLSPTRAAVCCDANIVAKSMSKDELLTTVVRKLYAYQTAMRSRDALTLGGLYEEKVTWLGKERSNAEIIAVHEESFKKDPAQWTLFDTCTLSTDRGASPAAAPDAGAPDAGAGADATATADCLTLFQRNGSVVVAMQRLVFSGAAKIKLIGDAVTARQPAPDGTMVEEKVTKERVGILLSAD